MVQFRKSMKFGPVRLTASKRGLGVSAGAGPLRVSHGADGKTRRTVRIPGTGIYDTKVVGDTGPKTPTQPQESPRPPVLPASSEPLMYVAAPASVPVFHFGQIGLAQPFVVKGYGSTIEFDGLHIVIHHRGFRPKVNRFDAEQRCLITDVADVLWDEPTALINGSLRLVLVDVDGPSSGMAAADRWAVLVTKQQVKNFTDLRGSLEFSKQNGTTSD